ncbi:NFACT family protein [Helicobacter cappadocius]|uniref:NFACT family protein n=1 Tax=Helicobacter cappadocius TaxID=3063998 RepID=A0AA90SSR4_9HELI|nr:MULTISPECIES: NFACT family protein [unclassified Helicobacter]MDO7253346.1 NFACT family protein [Helicobacter sp. faydin-H75]MDP2539224.1 NFACT family protein [Helicobacter sp. faydin-H76]
MKLWLLKNIARFLSDQEMIHNIKRIDDNLLKFELKEKIFYFDMTKGNSGVFLMPKPLLGAKIYNAPFDVFLSKLCSRAKIINANVDGNNRILKIECDQFGTYKNTRFYIQFEFTGKHTNVILLDDKNIVLEALRHINIDRSSREVRIAEVLKPLEQRNMDFSEEMKILSNEELFVQLENAYFENLDKKLKIKKEIITSRISKKIKKLQMLLDDLPKEDDLHQKAQKLSQSGTILLANLHQIQNFASEVRLKDFSGSYVCITLPEGIRTPQEGVNMMFKEAKKLTQKAKNTHIQVQNLSDKIDFLKQENIYIQNIQNIQDLVILEPKKQNKKSPPKYEVIFIEGIKVSIGRNKSENQSLLEEAKADDIWLHIRDIPSSHMIIHCGKGKIYDEVIHKAGEILVGINSIQTGNFSVDYTRRRFVKIIEGSNVVYAKHQTFHYKK